MNTRSFLLRLYKSVDCQCRQSARLQYANRIGDGSMRSNCLSGSHITAVPNENNFVFYHYYNT